MEYHHIQLENGTKRTNPRKAASSGTSDMGTAKVVPSGALTDSHVGKSEATPESSEFELAS